MTPVPLALLQILSAEIEVGEEAARPSATSATFDLGAWIARHNLDVANPKPWKGGTRWTFRTCPWNTAHTNGSAFLLQLANGAIVAGCHHNGCREKNWHALRDQVEPGWRAPHQQAAPLVAPLEARWEPPLPFHQIDLPVFPVDAFPSWLRLFVESLATATQTPIDLAALLSLSVLATCCAKKVAVAMKEGHVEPVNLFTATALASGNRKTAVFAAVTKPLEDHEESEGRRTAAEIAAQKAERQIKESLLKRRKDQAAAAKEKSERDKLTREAVELSVELDTAIVASPTRYIADDCTPEQLATLLTRHGGRIAVMSAEGDIFDLVAGRYSRNGTGNFGVLLKGHAGDPLRVDRAERSEFVRAPAITIGLAVQPDVIRGLADTPGFRGRGLIGRFLYAMPGSLLGRRDPDAPPVPDEIRAAYHGNVTALLNLPFGSDLDAAPHLLHLCPEAQLIVREFASWLEPQLSEFGELGCMTDWAGKLVGAVGRIAGLLHMACMAHSAAPWEETVLGATVKRAISIGKYLIPHARAAFAEMGADAAVQQAKTILRWIANQEASNFTKRDLHQALRGTFTRVEELDSPLELLRSHGYIAQRSDRTSGPGRKPSPTFDVNPLWRSKGGELNSEDCVNCE